MFLEWRLPTYAYMCALLALEQLDGFISIQY
jgi:hypothetical protein